VSGSRFDLHVLVLSEDSADKALPSLRLLAASRLRLVDPRYRAERVDLEPRDEEAQRAMAANLGKGRKAAGRQKLVTIARAVARHILDERGVVLFHVDADKAWSDRATKSENIAWFHDEVTLFVTRAVDDLIAKNPGAHDKDKRAILSRLCLVSPHWCIESWLYQNTALARALCHRHYRGLHADCFDRWEQDRGQLDEEKRPKDQICLGSKHNHELAGQGFPARAVYEAGKSFFETVERLASIPTVASGLAATHPGY
jgi:hypothetical protein